jgi:hypothetical protein
MKRASASRWWPAAILTAGLGLTAATERPAGATATFVVNNLDPSGVGFNDPTPVTPVGGNTGQTLGQQRLNVFKYATDTWGRALDSAVPILIDARFAPLNCGAVITLGQARATNAVAEVSGLPPDVFYPEPLAERIVGRDLSDPPGTADISAVFNGGLSDCDPTLDWYYGLDGMAGSLVDLAEVVLHELAHGLGFVSLVDLDSGELESGLIDSFSAHVFDNATGQMWSDMTDSQRAISIQNVRHVVWIGDNVMKAAPKVLAVGAPQLAVQPAVTGLTGNLGEMNFGPLVSNVGAVGPLFAPSSDDGCDPLANHAGAIFLLPGAASCSALNQVDNATNAGAKAVLLTDENSFSPPSSLELPPSQLQLIPVQIPVVGVTVADGQLLANHAGATVTLSAQSTRLVGTDDAGRPYLYASVPVRPGSSVSHWDELARPDLLEEPQTGYVHSHDVTMELALLRDIGWAPFCGNSQLDAGEQCDNGASNSDTAPNACRTTCQKAACGDGVIDTGEACDDGTSNSDTKANACRTTCRKAACGDSVIDTGEQCDDGARNGNGAGATCHSDCTGTPEGCGNSQLDPGEQCDNGANNSNTAPNACRANCQKAACGDGVIDTGEQCDNGASDSNTTPNACRANCRKAACGDGVVDTGEQCDDGAANGDGAGAKCRADCTVPAVAGPKSGCGCATGDGRPLADLTLLAWLGALALARTMGRPDARRRQPARRGEPHR